MGLSRSGSSVSQTTGRRGMKRWPQGILGIVQPIVLWAHNNEQEQLMERLLQEAFEGRLMDYGPVKDTSLRGG